MELGSGAKRGKNGWINIDLSSKSDLYWNLTEGIPFPDGSVQKIYSSHLFEHLSSEEGLHLLKECHRVLTTNGLFSICVPNAKIYIDAYMGVELTPGRGIHIPNMDMAENARISYINHIAYMNGHHKYMFDEQSLIFWMRSHGFSKARLRPFDPNLDSMVRDFESIYAESEK